MFRLNRGFYPQSWNEMDRLLKEMNEVFQDFGNQSRTKNVEFPPVNMHSNEDQLYLTVELPGINPEELIINALEDTLYIQGERKIPKGDEEKKEIVYHRRERKNGKFKRVFKLPFNVERDKIEAKYKDGILEISLPRLEREKPKFIKVNISE